jgi:hypothetical protein
VEQQDGAEEETKSSEHPSQDTSDQELRTSLLLQEEESQDDERPDATTSDSVSDATSKNTAPAEVAFV